MKYSEDIKPITYMKTKSAELVDQVSSNRRPVIITQSGKAKVVIQDVETFERDRQTLLMLKLLSQGEDDIKSGRIKNQNVVMKKMERKYFK